MEGDKMMLTQTLRDSQSVAEHSQAELQALLARLMQLHAHIDSLKYLHGQANKNLPQNAEVS